MSELPEKDISNVVVQCSELLEKLYIDVHLSTGNYIILQALRLIFTFGKESGSTSFDSYTWLLDRMPTLPYFVVVLGSLTYALRKVCVTDLVKALVGFRSRLYESFIALSIVIL